MATFRNSTAIADSQRAFSLGVAINAKGVKLSRPLTAAAAGPPIRNLWITRSPALRRVDRACKVKMAFVTLYALEMRDATPRPRGRCAWQGYRPPRDSGPASSGAFLDAPLDPAHERKRATNPG